MFLGMGAVFVGAPAGVANITGAISRARPADQTHTLGELMLEARSDPWQMTLRAPNGEVLWQESLDQTLSYRTTEGQTYRARRMASCTGVGDGGVQMIAETDDPLVTIALGATGPRAFRGRSPDTQRTVASIGGALDPHRGALRRRRRLRYGQRLATMAKSGPKATRRQYGASMRPAAADVESRYGVTPGRFERSRWACTDKTPLGWHAPAASVVFSYGRLKDLNRRNAELTVCRRSRRAGRLASGKRRRGADAVITEMNACAV
jgi:hypothetical protein